MLRTDGRTDGRTHTHTRTHRQRENSIPTTNKVCGGIIIFRLFVKLMHQDQSACIHRHNYDIKYYCAFHSFFFWLKSVIGCYVPLFLVMSPLFQRWWDIVPNFEISWQNPGHHTRFFIISHGSFQHFTNFLKKKHVLNMKFKIICYRHPASLFQF